MNRFPFYIVIICVAVLFSLVVSSCGPHTDDHAEDDGHGHGSEAQSGAEVKAKAGGHDDHGTETEGATYTEGKGIALMDETAAAIGLKLVDVTEQSLQPRLNVPAQVYRAANEPAGTYTRERSNRAYATALLDTAQAEGLKPGLPLSYRPSSQGDASFQGRIWRLVHAQVSVLGKVELLMELEDPQHQLAVGDSLETILTLNQESAQNNRRLVVPKPAILRTSLGTYAYVQNGSFLLRTEIKTGTEDETHVEITDGLYEGDSIALQPVEALYMIELRATKGGGHSH